MNDVSGSSSLTLVDVTKMIAEAGAGETDWVSMGMQLFNRLGENATLSGDVLRQALSDSGINLSGPGGTLIASIQTITKVGSLVTVTNRQELRPVLHQTTVRLKQIVTFQVGTDEAFPTISKIVGVAARELLIWIEIAQIQLRQHQGERIVHVDTSAGSRDFVLPSSDKGR